tara:strand:+ start:262 stop:894 length:633 start_codon:yes stop_codon:yes gene_type:complete
MYVIIQYDPYKMYHVPNSDELLHANEIVSLQLTTPRCGGNPLPFGRPDETVAHYESRSLFAVSELYTFELSILLLDTNVTRCRGRGGHRLYKALCGSNITNFAKDWYSNNSTKCIHKQYRLSYRNLELRKIKNKCKELIIINSINCLGITPAYVDPSKVSCITKIDPCGAVIAYTLYNMTIPHNNFHMSGGVATKVKYLYNNGIKFVTTN